MEAWQQYHTIIVTELSEEAWLKVWLGVEAVYMVQAMRGMCQKDTTISETDFKAIVPVLHHIETARHALVPFHQLDSK
jgi:hypothetical protein